MKSWLIWATNVGLNSMKESTKRKYLTDIVKNYLETAKSMMTYYKAMANDKDQKVACFKSLKKIEKAIESIDKIKHIEILDYLHSTFIGNNAIAYSVSGSVVNAKKMKHYDTDKGIIEFRELIEEQRQESLERERKRQESIEALKKAKELGKKIEMVYDPKTKTTKPMLVDKVD